MSRRHTNRTASTGPSPDAGNDSFLDILANLVGILVILVVVVAIRVQQTVPAEDVAVVDDAVMNDVEQELTSRPPVWEPPAPPEPTIIRPPAIVLGPEDLPINGLFAAPRPVVEDEPSPDETLRQEVEMLRAKLASLAEPVANVVDPSRRNELERETESLLAAARADEEAIANVREVIATRKAEYEQLQQNLGRVVRELEQLDEPAEQVISLEHDVRALAKLAGRDQVLVHLAGNRVTVLPVDELAPLMYSSLRRKLNAARFDGLYNGRVGPVDGVELHYELDRNGTSPIDTMRQTGTLPLWAQASFWLDVTDGAISEPIEAAVQVDSNLQLALIQAPQTASITAFVYPDSYAAARTLQTFAQNRGIPLALRPMHDGVPVTHSPFGSRAMAQ